MSTEDLAGRRKDRGRKARRTAIWGVVYQGMYAATQLAGLGMLVRYVGKEQYGLWMTVLALTTWMPLVALGQPATLLTKLGAVALTDRQAAQRIFSASAMPVIAVSLVLLAALMLIGPFLPWGRLLNAEGDMTHPVAGVTTIAALTVSLLSLPAILGGFAIFAHQRGELVHMIMCAGSLVSLGGTGVAIWLHQPLWLVGSVTLSGPLLGGMVLWALGLATELVPRPRWMLVDRGILREMMTTGFLFFLIDATALLLLRTPDVIVAQIHGVDAVGPFASVGRFPLLMIALFQAVLLPFWPALAEAAQRGDQDWIRRIAKHTLVLILAIWAAGAAGIWTLGPTLVRLWMGSAEFANSGLIAAAGLQSLAFGLFAWLSILLGALSLQRALVLVSGVASLVFLPLALFCGSRFGPVGVALAQASALLFCAVPAASIFLYRKLARGSSRRPAS